MAIFIIDAGHGPNTAGKRCYKSFDPNETREYELNSRIAAYVVDLLDIRGHMGIRVDDVMGNKDIPVSERARKANTYYNAKAYISIHHNADPDKVDDDGVNDAARGITVFHYPTSEDSERAERMYDILIEETGLRGNRRSPIIGTKDLCVIRETRMPALLIENGFMDNKDDVAIILTDLHARLTAKAIVRWCLEQVGEDFYKKSVCDCDCPCCEENCR